MQGPDGLLLEVGEALVSEAPGEPDDRRLADLEPPGERVAGDERELVRLLQDVVGHLLLILGEAPEDRDDLLVQGLLDREVVGAGACGGHGRVSGRYW